MSALAGYRVHDGVDVSLVDPLAGRLEQLLDRFTGRVLIISGRRSYSEQVVLWERYLAGGPLAARPGTSLHERGQAADLRIVDAAVSWGEVHDAAADVGLRFPIASEDWHIEADPAWVEPPPVTIAPSEEDDMSLTIHRPHLRPGTTDVVDFPWLPEEGRLWGVRQCSSTLVVAMATEAGNSMVTLNFDAGSPVSHQLAWGKPLVIGVPVAGMVSVSGENLVAHAREAWA